MNIYIYEYKYDSLNSLFLGNDGNERFLFIRRLQAKSIRNTIYINKQLDNFIVLLNKCKSPARAYVNCQFVLHGVFRIYLGIWHAS